MSPRPKITLAQIAWARDISRKRRALYRALKMMPTNADIARELHCSERWLERVISEKVRKITPQIVPRETNRPVLPANEIVEVNAAKL